MKRHDALIPLTHDHHHALAQARQLRLAAAASTAERRPAAEEFIDFFGRDTLVHFREEEELIFPLVVDEAEAEGPLARLMLEHLRIHALVRRLVSEHQDSDPRRETMEELSETLEGHIRFEEKTFFPLVERLARSELGSVELAPRDRNSADPDSSQSTRATFGVPNQGGRTALLEIPLDGENYRKTPEVSNDMQGRHMETLGRDECIKLMERHPACVGRVALAGPRPVIFPVNYALDRGNVVFRTDPGTKFHAAVHNSYVAFEVDWVEPTWQIGWSVVVRGQARVVSDPDELARLRRLPLLPWASGEKENFVSIDSKLMSGRRLTD